MGIYVARYIVYFGMYDDPAIVIAVVAPDVTRFESGWHVLEIRKDK